jgi:RNA-directed DNA polymerase
MNPRTEAPTKLDLLRIKLGQKAKAEPKFRFYSLYSHLYRADILKAAYERVKENRGSPGVDGITFEAIKHMPGGEYAFLLKIQEMLQNKTYKPEPVLRVYIPKSNGKLRPLGIPTIKDRVVQMAMVLILEPIFEQDFLNCSYGFRPGRRAHDAVKDIVKNIKDGYNHIYDADMSAYFDTIPHDKLIKCLEMRIADQGVLKLIKMWLKAPIIEKKDKGLKPPIKPTMGTPQGGVISPLLANLYLHYFDKVFHGKDGPKSFANARLIRYADDFVVMTKKCCKRVVEFIEEKLENWLGLKINREKTRIVKIAPEQDALDFLGFTFQYEKSHYKRGQVFLRICPSKKAMQNARNQIKELTSCKNNFLEIEYFIKRINQFTIGWGNYFRLGHPGKAFNKMSAYAGEKIIKHLQGRSQKGYKLPKDEKWHHHLLKLGYKPLRA